MLQDAHVMETRFGSYISAIGTVGEFGPIVAVALLLTNKEPLLTSLLLLAFIVVAVATVLLAARAHPPRVVEMLSRHMESSAQLPVRVSLLFIVLLVLLAETLGLDVLLGAFAAGIVVRLFSSEGRSPPYAEAGGHRIRVPHPGLLRGERYRVRCPRVRRGPACSVAGGAVPGPHAGGPGLPSSSSTGRR